MNNAKQRIQPNSGLAMFVREHDRILTSIGVMVVFMTFVAREGVQDALKNRRDSVESARRDYQVSADTTSLLNRLGGVFIEIDDLTKELTHHPPGFEKGDLDGEVVSQFNFYKNQSEAIERKLLSAKALLRALPQLPPESAKADAILKEIQDLQRRIDTEETDIQMDAAAASPAEKNLPPEVEEKLNKITLAYTLRNSDLNYRIDQLVAKSLVRADEERDRYLCWYRLSVVTSWVLYALGASLGLFTAIYGRAGSASPE